MPSAGIGEGWDGQAVPPSLGGRSRSNNPCGKAIIERRCERGGSTVEGVSATEADVEVGARQADIQWLPSTVSDNDTVKWPPSSEGPWKSSRAASCRMPGWPSGTCTTRSSSWSRTPTTVIRFWGSRAGWRSNSAGRARAGPRSCRVRDFADGMTTDQMNRKLGRIGGRVSGLEAGHAVRGTNSRGAKDIAALGTVTFESIAGDGRMHTCRIYPNLEYEADDAREVTQQLRKRLAIAKGTGTLVTIEIEPTHRIPKVDTLKVPKVAALVRLRDIVRHEKTTLLVKGLRNSKHRPPRPCPARRPQARFQDLRRSGLSGREGQADRVSGEKAVQVGPGPFQAGRHPGQVPACHPRGHALRPEPRMGLERALVLRPSHLPVRHGRTGRSTTSGTSTMSVRRGASSIRSRIRFPSWTPHASRD